MLAQSTLFVTNLRNKKRKRKKHEFEMTKRPMHVGFSFNRISFPELVIANLQLLVILLPKHPL